LTLQQWCNPRANNAEKKLHKVVLDIYSKSGHGKILQPMVYSDKDKNTAPVHSPAVTLLGESTPEAFFDGLGQEHIATGLIPRFSIIEYCGGRPRLNENGMNVPPNPHLTAKFKELLMLSLSNQQKNTAIKISMSGDAKRLLSEFNQHADSRLDKSEREVERQLWNRAHLKALKMAGLIAVGHNMYDPVVSGADAQWAIDFVKADVESIVTRFDEGSVGTGDHRLEREVIKAMKAYPKLSKAKRLARKVPKYIAGDSKFVPYSYLRWHCIRLAAFKNDRRGAGFALKTTLEEMVKAEMLYQTPVEALRIKFKNKSLNTVVYQPGRIF
jgi:hypothetical protein